MEGGRVCGRIPTNPAVSVTPPTSADRELGGTAHTDSALVDAQDGKSSPLDSERSRYSPDS